MRKAKAPPLDEDAVAEQETRRKSIPGGLKHHQSHLRASVGLYRLILHGRIVALGTGTDKKGGLAKRLSDFRRQGPGGRRFHTGQITYDHLDPLDVEALITGERHEPDSARAPCRIPRPWPAHSAAKAGG